MENPLLNWLVDPCGLQQVDAEDLSKTLSIEHKIMSIESLSNVLREQPAFLSEVHCPLAYRLQIASHLYIHTVKSLDLASCVEIVTACANLGFPQELLEALKRCAISGYVLSSLPLNDVIDSASSEDQVGPAVHDIHKLQNIVDRWKKEGIPVHLFGGIEHQCYNGGFFKKRKATDEISRSPPTNSSVAVNPPENNAAVYSSSSEVKNDSVDDKGEQGPKGTQEIKNETSSSEIEMPNSGTGKPVGTLKGAGGGGEVTSGVSSSESVGNLRTRVSPFSGSITLATAVPSKVTSATVEQHTAAILKNKGLLLSTSASEQLRGAKYFVCLNTNLKGMLKLVVEHKVLECLCTLIRQSNHEMLSLYAISAINNIFAMDKERTCVVHILTEQEHMCPDFVKRLEEVHNFDFYTAVLWCLQILAASSALRDELISLNIIPLTIKVFQKTQENDIPLRVQILTFTSNLLQTQPIPPLEVVRPLLVNIVIPAVESPKCGHPALTAVYFFTHHPVDSEQREQYLLEVFRSETLLCLLVEQARNISQVKINQVARKVIENLSSTRVKDNADKLVSLDVADALVQQLLSPRSPSLLSAVITVNNLGATSITAVHSFLTSDLYPAVCRAYSRLHRKDYVREAVYALKHAVTGPISAKQLESLVEAGMLTIVCDVFVDTTEVECVLVTLSTLFLLLHKCPSAAVYDSVIRQVYELDGWKAVDKCRKHEDIRVREKADTMNIVAIRAHHWGHNNTNSKK